MNFVIQGKEFRVDTGDPVDADIAKALEEAGIPGGPDGWTARTKSGAPLDGSKTLEEQGITPPARYSSTRAPGAVVDRPAP